MDTPAPSLPDIPLLSCDEMADLGMTVSELLIALEDDLGPEAVWTFTRLYGGRELAIPRKEKARTGPLARALGPEIALWLAERHYGRLIVPLGPNCTAARGLAATRALSQAGVSITETAHRLRCNCRTISRHRSKLKDAGFL